MMQLCDDGHDEIVYTGKLCPVCNKMKDIEYNERNIKELVAQIESLKDELAEARRGN